MTDYTEIDDACPGCGWRGVMTCSLPSCPMKDKQKMVRERYQNSQKDSSEESEK